MNTHYLTLGQAAKQVACSKATVSKALKVGGLSGDRQADGSFRIDPAELMRWDSERSARGIGASTRTPPATGVNSDGDPRIEVARLQERLAAAEAERERDRGTIEDLRERLDASEAERRADKERFLPAPRPAGGWFRRLLG